MSDTRPLLPAAEVPKFIARVRELVRTEEAMTIMAVMGVPDGLAFVCACVQQEFNVQLAAPELAQITQNIGNWLVGILNGTECFCGKCGKESPIPVNSPAVHETN